MSSRILVIGTAAKYRDSDMYSWRRMEGDQRPLIGDYQYVVIYLPSLGSESFENPRNAFTVLSDIRKGVVDALQGNTHIYFIASPPVPFPNVNSYTVMPFILSHDIETGKNFKSKDAAALPYLNKITTWQVAFKDRPHNFANTHLTPVFISLARSNHEKNAAFRIEFSHQATEASAGVLDVLPPIMDGRSPSEGKTINELLDFCVPVEEVETKLPERFRDIILPGEAELRQEDTKLEQTVSRSVSRREVIRSDLNIYEQFKGVVAFKGKTLERCVDAALKKVGIDYEPTETNKEDGNLELADDFRVPVEIKGHEARGASEDDLRQLIARLRDETAGQPVRGVLIVNPFYKLPDQERSNKKAFENSVVQQATAFNVALLDTRTLLKYVADQLKDSDNNLQATLTTTTGIVPHQKR